MYGIPTLAADAAGQPIPGTVVVGYVGQTRQTVKQREGQHRDCQPFGDLIVGGSWVIEEGVWTNAELDEREQHYIRHGAVLVPGRKPQRPVYNIDCNRDNRRRIPPWDAVAQRQAREPGWQPSKYTKAQQRWKAPAVRGLRVGGVALRAARWLLGAPLLCLWVALFAAFWFAGGDVWPGWDAPRNAAVGASVVAAAGVWAWSYTRRPRRRRRAGRRR